MKKNTKRILSLLLVLMMVVSLFPTAYAAETEDPFVEEDYGSSWEDWDVQPAEEETPAEEEQPAEEPVDEDPFVEEIPEEPVVEEPVEEPAPAEEPAPVEEPAPAEEPVVVEEPVVSYPANTFYYVGGSGLRVTVDAPEGAFPADAEMIVKELKPDAVQELFDASGNEGKVLVAADISFANAEGELEPNGNVKVSITSTEAAYIEDAKVYHIDDDQNVTEVDQLPGAEGGLLNTRSDVADARTYSFEADSFSVYLIAHAGDDEPILVQARATYHFLNDDFTPYSFVNKNGDYVDYQIVKNAEVLEDVGTPVVGLEKNFLGWFIVTKNNDGTYTYSDKQINFEDSNQTFAECTVTTGDIDVYVAARFGEAFIVTFWDNAKGSPESEMHIVSKRLVYADETGKGSVRVDNVTVPSTATSVLTGWTSDDYAEGETTYTLLEKPEWDNVTKSFNLYPIFSEGHWLRFSGGPAGSGAGYRSAIFVTANTTASEITNLGTVAREGYTFAGWYYDGFDGTEAATNASGVASNPADLLSRVQNAEGDLTLYGHWTGKQVNYRVATWFENADDTEYSFGEVTTRQGAAGTTTNVTASSVQGFTAETIEQQEIKGDGTTIVNVYYKRNEYSLVFYNSNGSREITALRITAKFGADVHLEWPGVKSGTESYSALWYLASEGRYVSGASTMPINGASYRQLSGGRVYINSILYTQNVDGSTNFTQYVDRPFSYSSHLTVGVEEFTPIKGFRVNAANANDAASIRNGAENYGSDPNATYDNRYNTSPRVNASTQNAPRVLKNGQYYYTYSFYYLRNQYSVSFNLQKSGVDENGSAVNAPADLADIYYEANIATVKATQIAALNNQFKVGETKIEVTGEGTYVFQGWYDNAAGLGDPFDFDQEMPAGNIILYAKWERVWYLIDIDPRGGEILPDVNEVTYTWLQYGQKLEQYNIRRDYVEAPDDYTGETYYYVEVLSSDDPHVNDASGYYWSGYRKGFYIKSSDVDNSAYSWWKENGFIDTATKYRPATTDDNYAFVGWYNRDTDSVYDFNAEITGPTGIYARWRRAGLFSVQYHTENGTEKGLVDGELVATDASYADQAVTKIPYKPTNITTSSTEHKAYVFKGWAYAKLEGGEYVQDGEVQFQQGDDFTVDAAKADSSHYIHLIAVYEPADSDPDSLPITEVTFDPNFPTDAGTTSGERTKYEGVPLNTRIDLAAESFKYDKLVTDEHGNVTGSETVTAAIPVFTTTVYEQIGWNYDKDAADAGTVKFKMDDVVGVDNKDPKANVLYAVWGPKYFYVFHSSNGLLEAFALKDLPTSGKFDLVSKVTEGSIYGGYYKTYGGYTVTDKDIAAVKAAESKSITIADGFVAYDGSLLKNGDTRFWTKKVGNELNYFSDPGNAMTPVADTVYYLKEVPSIYLATNGFYTYDYNNGDKITKLYLLTVIDDSFYSDVGYYIVSADKSAKVVSTFSYQKRNDTAVEKITADTLIKQRGYLGVVDAASFISSLSGGIIIKPYWKTLDGVEIYTAQHTLKGTTGKDVTIS